MNSLQRRAVWFLGLTVGLLACIEDPIIGIAVIVTTLVFWK